VEVRVWKEGLLYHASSSRAQSEPQVCMAIDLFEVIAELSGLDLERAADAREALHLAGTAQDNLASPPA
jgi:hypothetical protein